MKFRREVLAKDMSLGVMYQVDKLEFWPIHSDVDLKFQRDQDANLEEILGTNNFLKFSPF
jgi:hypothetical protein